MSSLLDRAATVQSILLDRGRLEAGVQATQRLTQQKGRADASISGINASTELERRLSAESVIVAPIDKNTLESARKARTSLRTSATKLDSSDLSDEDTVSILGRKTLEDAMKAAESVVDRAIGRIQKALQDERNAGLPANIDDAIPDVPGQAARRAHLEVSRHRLKAPIGLNRGDLTPEGIGRVLDAMAARRADLEYWRREHPILLEALAKEDPEVQRFLHAAASEEGAPLAMLTSAVLDRLAADGLLDDFRIRRQ